MNISKFEDIDWKLVLKEAENDLRNDQYIVETYKELTAGPIQKIVEIAIKRALNKLYNNDWYHPADNSGLPDIVHIIHPEISVEIKATIGWKTGYIKKDGTEQETIVWTNGTIQESVENFLFIYLDRDYIKFKNAWLVKNMSYTDVFTMKRESDMRTSRNIIENLAEKII